MFGVFALLGLLGRAAGAAALRFYSLALAWVCRWLPVLYIPVVLSQPLPAALPALPGVRGGTGARTLGPGTRA